MAKKDSNKLIPGDAYKGLGYGSDISFGYEHQEKKPIDGSNQLLRTLSPFTMSFVLPGPYGVLRRGDGTSLSNQDLVDRLVAPKRRSTGVEAEVSAAQNEIADLFYPDDEEGRAQLLETLKGGVEFFGESFEAQRSLEERGLTGVPTTRSVGHPLINDNYDRLFDSALQKFDTFSEAQSQARTRDQFFQTNSSLGGNFVRTVGEEFIVSGEKKNSLRDEKEPRGTDQSQALDIATQLLEIINAPPLTLLINPNTLSLAKNKVLQFTERTKNGYLLQSWGEEQPVLSLTMVCGAWISEGRGVQFASKRDSAAWQNLMHVYQIYRNNGYIYDRINNSQGIHAVGSIALEYDGWVYIGNFDSFSYSEEEEKPNGGVSFDISFTVNQMYDDSPKVMSPLKPMKSITPNPVFSSAASQTQRLLLNPSEGTGPPRESFFSVLEGFSPTSEEVLPGGTTEGEVPPNLQGATETQVTSDDFEFDEGN